MYTYRTRTYIHMITLKGLDVLVVQVEFGYKCIHTHTYTHIHMYLYIHVYTYINIYAYTYTRAHTPDPAQRP